MGGIASRRNAGVEEVDISTNNAYRFPPRSGCYFGSHFIMGGERFETTQPEAYLFGDNQDLNFLGNRPIPFPYPAPQAHEPTKTLKSLVNIRKDSLRFVKVVDDSTPNLEESPENYKYNIEFTFDTDVRVAITIFYFATEEITSGQAVYQPRDTAMNSETFHYKRGANQTFCQSTHIIEPAKFSEEEWQYNPDKEIIPVVIQCIVEDEAEFTFHSHVLFGIVEKTSELGYVLKPLKQKQMVDGLCYLIQEIYGIENKNTERAKDDDFEDNGSECVICMSDTRDTIILPCRHLCLCNGCADNLRYQANNCPICRAPFRALLQIRAMRKKVDLSPPPTDSEDNTLSQEGVPPGYEAVSLIEALNGPSAPATPTVPIPVNAAPPQPPPYGQYGRNVQSSTRSASSASGRRATQPIAEEAVTVDVTMATEAKEEEDDDDVAADRAETPEVVMSSVPPDPVKPERKSSTKKKSPVKETETCEIVNELNVPDTTDISSNKSNPPEYTEAADSAAAAMDMMREVEELCLPSHVAETGDAPGSPNTDSSGSSYSSTNSSKGLLEQGKGRRGGGGAQEEEEEEEDDEEEEEEGAVEENGKGEK